MKELALQLQTELNKIDKMQMITYEQRKLFFQVANNQLNMNKKMTSCSTCVARVVDAVRNWVNSVLSESAIENIDIESTDIDNIYTDTNDITETDSTETNELETNSATENLNTETKSDKRKKRITQK